MSVNRYMVFAFPSFYPNGGMRDYKNSFTEYSQALYFIKSLDSDEFQYAHIFDLDTQIINYFTLDAPYSYPPNPLQGVWHELGDYNK